MLRFVFMSIVLGSVGGAICGAQEGVLDLISGIGGPHTVWQGLESAPDGGQVLAPGHEAILHFPAGPRGWYVSGFRSHFDGSSDWRAYQGLRLTVRLPVGRTWRLLTTLATPPQARVEFLTTTRAQVEIVGSGTWQQVNVPWAAFDAPRSQQGYLEFINELRLQGSFSDAASGGLAEISRIAVVAATGIAVEAEVRGQALPAGGTAIYPLIVRNITAEPQALTLSFSTYGFEAMPAQVEPAALLIPPGGSAAATVTVHVPATGIPSGGHEQQTLCVIAAGSAAPITTVDFITACDVARPSILHTTAEWAEVRAKIATQAWAKAAAAEFVKAADEWTVPTAATPAEHAKAPEKHAYVFLNQHFETVYKVVVAWQITGDRRYAEKIAEFLRRLSDEQSGYPATFAGTQLGSPQEGGNFQNVAIAYDALRDSGVLSGAERAAIERTLRLFMHTYETDLTVGNMGNWSTAASTAGLMCALAIGDLSAADRYINGPAGFIDFLSKGVMDDGWWWECSTSYNLWVASELTQSALACRPWGIDLLNLQLPTSYSPLTIICPWAITPQFGMSFAKWGPTRRNTRTVKQLWDAIPGIADYRSVLFGMNDGHEERIGGSRMELAYFAFRDPVYAAMIKQGDKRDLVYGVAELPDVTPTPWFDSRRAENIGFSLLRSQDPQRPPRERIQAVLKDGTQGGYHGHFDRASLVSLMRYGRSFYNPESIWWGYPNFMYKFYVQTSLSHNMVVVDQKMQEAVPSTQLLFHSGPLMQVAAVESDARWSDPPYLGMTYREGDTPEKQMRQNVQSLPLVSGVRMGEVGPYGDRVRQRRLLVVTDDYVVVADDLRATQPHTFDNLWQMRECTGITVAGQPLKAQSHTAQFNADPRGSGQFITNCAWYRANGPSVAGFTFRFGPGADTAGTRSDHNEDGVLDLDLHAVWPIEHELMLGMPPEAHGGNQWVTYQVSADGKTLAQGESGMWILGHADLDVAVDGAHELLLSVMARGAKKQALFWADARLVTADGHEFPIVDPALATVSCIIAPSTPGLDYYGGPIVVGGDPARTALPTQPIQEALPGVIRIALDRVMKGAQAVRFKARLGADFPFGDESQRRRVYSIRSTGTTARFLTVLEPHEGRRMVVKAEATAADRVRITLTDGREQELTIHGLDGDAANLAVDFRSYRGTQLIASEQTAK